MPATDWKHSSDHCTICGQLFLFEMDSICSDCETIMFNKRQEEIAEEFRADLFDETTNDLVPNLEARF